MLHTETLRLIQLGGAHKQVLLHRLIGESVEVDQQYNMEFDEGVVYLGHPNARDGNSQDMDDEDSIWANDLLDLSTRREGSGSKIRVCSKSAGTKVLLSTFCQSVRSLPFCHSCSVGAVKLEMYEHQAPRRVCDHPYPSRGIFQCGGRGARGGVPRGRAMSALQTAVVGRMWSCVQAAMGVLRSKAISGVVCVCSLRPVGAGREHQCAASSRCPASRMSSSAPPPGASSSASTSTNGLALYGPFG